jgi:hypothetical protein
MSLANHASTAVLLLSLLLSLAAHFYPHLLALPGAAVPAAPPPAHFAAPTQLPGPASLHPLYSGGRCLHLLLTPTSRLEFCPFVQLRLFTARDPDWDRFSNLGAVARLGEYSAEASGQLQPLQQVFVNGDPCGAAAQQRSATVVFACAAGAEGAGRRSLQLLSAAEPEPCTHLIHLATPLACTGAQ